EIDTERKYDDSFTPPAATPEPATLLIMLIGIIGLVTIKGVGVRKGHFYFCWNTQPRASL
ncbi:MAG: PEP-CTERM sorting domain-containing protein, partial [Planctomycetaceae bacterium]|nr:PEP-CTERM sorting domain-containing protein [Planctomycetaceae bacterium]